MRLSLPPAPRPLGAYRAVVVRQGLGFVSGQLPIRDGALAFRGLLGRELGVADGRAAAQLSALNLLAQIGEALGGWERFGGLFRVEGLIAATAEFTEHAAVLDAASELLLEALGAELGAHARSVCAVAGLPGGAPIEIVATFALSGQGDLAGVR